MAESLLGRKAIGDARAEALTSISLAPDGPIGHAVLAAVESDAGRWRQAETAIREAIRLDPERARHYGVLAYALLQQGRPGRALVAVGQGLDRKPNDSISLNVRALALADLGRIGEARDVLRSALVSRPESAVLHSNLAFVLLNQGEPAEAREVSLEALRLDPTLAIAEQNLRASEQATTKPLAIAMRRAASWWYRRPIWERSLFVGGLAALTPISLVTGAMALVIGTWWLAVTLLRRAGPPGSRSNRITRTVAWVARAAFVGTVALIPFAGAGIGAPLAGGSGLLACIGLAVAAGARRPYRQLVFALTLVVIAVGTVWKPVPPVAAVHRPSVGVVLDDQVIQYCLVDGAEEIDVVAGVMGIDLSSIRRAIFAEDPMPVLSQGPADSDSPALDAWMARVTAKARSDPSFVDGCSKVIDLVRGTAP